MDDIVYKGFTDSEARALAHAVWNHLGIATAPAFEHWIEALRQKAAIPDCNEALRCDGDSVTQITGNDICHRRVSRGRARIGQNDRKEGFQLSQLRMGVVVALRAASLDARFCRAWLTLAVAPTGKMSGRAT